MCEKHRYAISPIKSRWVYCHNSAILYWSDNQGWQVLFRTSSSSSSPFQTPSFAKVSCNCLNPQHCTVCLVVSVPMLTCMPQICCIRCELHLTEYEHEHTCQDASQSRHPWLEKKESLIWIRAFPLWLKACLDLQKHRPNRRKKIIRYGSAFCNSRDGTIYAPI